MRPDTERTWPMDLHLGNLGARFTSLPRGSDGRIYTEHYRTVLSCSIDSFRRRVIQKDRACMLISQCLVSGPQKTLLCSSMAFAEVSTKRCSTDGNLAEVLPLRHKMPEIFSDVLNSCAVLWAPLGLLKSICFGL